MKAVPGTLQDGGAPFLTTHWSVVAACSDLTTGAAHAALTQLCRDYWPPLYSFVRRRGYSRADAQDLVQGFFAYLLQSKAYAQTDRNKGKFRSFLLASLKHYLSDVWDRERALKRGGDHEFVLLDEMDAAETLYASESVAATLDEEQQNDRVSNHGPPLAGRACGCLFARSYADLTGGRRQCASAARVCRRLSKQL